MKKLLLAAVFAAGACALAAEIKDTPINLLREGLEQSCTTAMPRVEIVRRFRPFVEDEIPRRFADAPKLVAHPRCDGAPPRFPTNPPKGASLPLVAVGPEGGWTDFELELLAKAGFSREEILTGLRDAMSRIGMDVSEYVNI